MSDKNNKPIISIIMAAHNSSVYIGAAINSVLKQTYKHWELLICDDLSTDDTFKKAEEFSKTDFRIHVYRNEKNLGTGGTRNVLLRQAAGRYITFLDSDDALLPSYLSSQLEFIIQTKAALITSGYYRKTEKTNTPFVPPKETTYNLCCKGNPLSCLTTFYDSHQLGQRSFDPTYQKSEDWVFWLNILKEGHICIGNPNVLAIYNINKGSKNRNKLSLIRYNYRVFHQSQKMNFFVSVLHVIQWIVYGLKKYRAVR